MSSADPDFILVRFMDHIKVPNHQKNLTHCHNCREKLSKSKNNCKLCGNLFCGLCLAKYHLAGKFLHKENSTLVETICFSCRDSCLLSSILKNDFSLKNSKMLEEKDWFSYKMTMVQNIRGNIKLLPPKGIQAQGVKCHLCSIVCGSKLKNCQVCGELYCQSCSVKMNLPEAFQIKKKNPCRVCTQCRFLIVGRLAIPLDDEVLGSPSFMITTALSPANIEKPEKIVDSKFDFEEEAEKSVMYTKPDNNDEWDEEEVNESFDFRNSKRNSVAPLPPIHSAVQLQMNRSPSLLENAEALIQNQKSPPVIPSKSNALRTLSQRIAANSSASPGGSLSFIVEVRLEYSTSSLARIEANSSMSLKDLDKALLALNPSLFSHSFLYLYQKTPIHQAHWPIIGAKTFKSGLEIRIVSEETYSRSSLISVQLRD